MTWRLFSWMFVCLWLGAAPLASAQEAKLAPAPLQEWNNAFADSRAEVEYIVRAPGGFKGRVTWALAEAANLRILPKGRGESPVTAAPDGMARVKFTLDFAAVNPGVMLKARLSATLIDDATGKAIATHEKTVWICHANPFQDRTKSLDNLKIVVYESDPKGKTTEALKLLKVPFEEEKNLATLEGRKDGLVIIGEGVSFKDEPGLAEVLVKMASRGITVICLAPSGGALPIPGVEQDHGDEISLRRHTIITQLDARLDAKVWSNSGKIIASTFTLKPHDGGVAAEVGDGMTGWPWLQIDYPQSKGRLIVCGFAVIANWQSSPTPRYLFAKIVEMAQQTSPVSDH